MNRRSLVGLMLALSSITACVETAPEVLFERADRYAEVRDLPAPVTEGSVPVERALELRRSARAFSPTPVSPQDIGQLFWAAQGITDRFGHRTAPSAGARYPLEMYAVSDGELLHYLPAHHQIETGPTDPAAPGLARATFGQEWIDSAPVLFVITGVVSRTETEYGAVGQRLMDREAGHAAQNLLLEATALGLGAVPVGGFDPVAIGEILLLPVGEEVLYLLPVGHPAPAM